MKLINITFINGHNHVTLALVSDLDSPIDDIQRDEPIEVDELEMLRGLVPLASHDMTPTHDKLTLDTKGILSFS